MRVPSPAFAAIPLLVGCQSVPHITIGDERPARVYVPDGADEGGATLLLMLHGYEEDAKTLGKRIPFTEVAAGRNTVVAWPEGEEDPNGHRFWNAWDACCDEFSSGVDDLAYLVDLIGAIQEELGTDPAQVFVGGHDAGAFMAYRLACERANLITGVLAIGGTMEADEGFCDPARPVRVTHVHSIDDEVFEYPGGVRNAASYLGASETTIRWSTLNGCEDEPLEEDAADFLAEIPGRETRVARAPGCPARGRVSLWTMESDTHTPELGEDAVGELLDELVGPYEPPETAE
jgi:polyhydroxybutyrate depolymerase